MLEAANKRNEVSPDTYMDGFQNIIAPGCEPRMTKEYKPRFAQTFDKYKTPDELKKFVLETPKIQSLIEFYSKKKRQSHETVEKQIKDILDEIGLARNLAIIRWCGMCITAVGKRICSGIYVNGVNLNKVKAGLGKNPVLYLPSHRSYCDFILMSYICFHYEIEIPGIAAGMDFHSMFGMGTMLRKTGAFFMRRSFSGDEIYWDVFREYVHALMTSYHIGVEFFIEGTRSRNFKALVPKVGLLSMALEPFFMGEVSDVTIVPVSVSYERLLEEQLFVYELLGIPKPKESTKGFFKALKIIEQRFGRMYLDFGEPISVKEYFGKDFDRTKYSNLAGYLQKLDLNEIVLVKKLANEVVYQQQRRIVITTFNLIVLYYSYRSYQGLETNIQNLADGIILLKKFFEHLGALIATNEKSVKFEIMETIEIHSNIMQLPQGHLKLNHSNIKMSSINSKNLKGYPLSKDTMEMAVPSLSAQLYINACMFWLATPAITVICAKKFKTECGNSFSVKDLQLKVDELLSIYSNEFVIIPAYKDKDFEKSLKILTHFKVLDITADGRISYYDNEISTILLSSLVPFLCMYYRLTETISIEFENVEFTEKELLVATQKHVENLLNSQANLTHPYCLALDNLSVAVTSLAQNSILNKIKVENLTTLKYSSNLRKLKMLQMLLHEYCNILPFEFITSEISLSVLSKL